HLGNAIELRRRLGHAAAIGARHQHMHLAAELLRRAKRLGRGVAQGPVVVFGKKERGHHSTPASFFSLPTRSTTEATLMPLLRRAGSTVLSTSRRGAVSTP